MMKISVQVAEHEKRTDNQLLHIDVVADELGALAMREAMAIEIKAAGSGPSEVRKIDTTFSAVLIDPGVIFSKGEVRGFATEETVARIIALTADLSTSITLETLQGHFLVIASPSANSLTSVELDRLISSLMFRRDTNDYVMSAIVISDTPSDVGTNSGMHTVFIMESSHAHLSEEEQQLRSEEVDWSLPFAVIHESSFNIVRENFITYIDGHDPHKAWCFARKNDDEAISAIF